MPDYSKAKLYAIRSHQTEDIYIGSSCVRLSKRLHRHRSSYKRHKEGRSSKYTTSYEIIKHPDHYIELIRAIPCSSKEELHKLEGQEIRKRNCVNKNIPGRTRDEILARKKRYHHENKDTRNCLCGESYDFSNSFKKNRHYGTEQHKKYVKDFYTRLNQQLIQQKKI